MEINTIFQNIYQLPLNTPLQDVLYYENLIFKKIQEIENDILQQSIYYQDLFKNNIIRKENQIDKLTKYTT